jgi:glycosyltransferase involved in cell wall biosynthesis
MITVIVPVYNNNKQLYDFFKGMEDQTLDSNLFEVIVVDNGSTIKPDYKSNSFNLKIVNCSEIGSYSARNMGISLSAGSYIAFTDSDCIPDRNWLKNIFFHISNDKKIDIISGDIHYFFKDKKPNIYEIYDTVFGFGQEALFKKNASVTANLIVKKELFNRVGKFKTNKFSGSDTEWVRLAFANKAKFIFVPEIIIRHPARYSYKQLLIREKRHYGGIFVRFGFSKINYLLQFITSLYAFRPPVNAILTILKKKNLSFKNKFLLFLILASLRVNSFKEHIKLMHGVKKTR